MLCHHIRLRYVRRKSTPSRQACSEHHVYGGLLMCIVEIATYPEVWNSNYCCRGSKVQSVAAL